MSSRGAAQALRPLPDAHGNAFGRCRAQFPRDRRFRSHCRGRIRTRATGEREIFFRRIDDAHKMSCQPFARDAPHRGFEFAERRQKIAEPYDLRVAAHRRFRREARIRWRHRQFMRDAAQRNTARRWRTSITQQPDAFAAANEQRTKRHGEKACAIDLRRGSRCKAHGRSAVAPQPHRLRRFPFALAHEEMLRLRGLPPVDRGRRVFGLIATELPERLADTRLAPSMHAEADGRRQTFCSDQQRRQRRRNGLGLLA